MAECMNVSETHVRMQEARVLNTCIARQHENRFPRIHSWVLTNPAFRKEITELLQGK